VQPGSPEEIEELYKWADVSVVPLKPNLHASGITAVAEAALFGVPVICTDTGGIRGYFSKEEVRYVLPRDPEALSRALQQLAADDELRFSMASKAQARMIASKLSSRVRAHRLAALSRELLGLSESSDQGGVSKPTGDHASDAQPAIPS